MQNSRVRSLLWLPGPVVAIGLASWAVVAEPGPGAFVLLVFAALVFLVLVPILQIVLLCLPALRGKYVAACGAALVAGLFIVLAPAAYGIFSFY